MDSGGMPFFYGWYGEGKTSLKTPMANPDKATTKLCKTAVFSNFS